MGSQVLKDETPNHGINLISKSRGVAAPFADRLSLMWCLKKLQGIAMNEREIKSTFLKILIYISFFLFFGCAAKSDVSPKLINQEIAGIGFHGKSKKYIKNGITVVYLTGTPYEIGFAHGKLCKAEIRGVNKFFLEAYDRLEKDSKSNWLKLSHQFENNIPEEYIEEMRGISDGADIPYDKILFLNTLSTIDMGNKCFAFALRDDDSRIFTIRQVDGYKGSDLYKKMILFIVKPERGFGFAAILNPGWVDGESGINEKGLTVSQNNIGIKQNNWNVTPITHLSRYMLQYSETFDDVEELLERQQAYPARLIFTSSREGAAAFEFANEEKARINMKNGFLALSNHARFIPSKKIGNGSAKRLSYAEDFFKEHAGHIYIEKAIDLVRSPRISRSTFWDSFRVHNRQSFIFSPVTLDFWIAIPPGRDHKAACLGTFVGFNLRNELYGTGDGPNPPFFPPAN